MSLDRPLNLNLRLLLSSTLAALSACKNPAGAVKSDADLFKKQYSSQIQSIQNGGQTLRFAWSGNSKKRAILFVHGSPGSWEGWSHFLLNRKLQAEFQLISVDRPGYGGTEPGIGEPSLIEQAKLITHALSLNQSGLPAILVGHSYGGPVVAQMAMSHPSQYAGIIFVASPVAPELEEDKWFQYPATLWPIRALIPNSLRVCNEEIIPLRKELSRMLPEWPKITANIIIIHGNSDPLVPPENFDFLVRHLRKSQIIKASRLDHVNHFIPWEHPELIEDAIWALALTLPATLPATLPERGPL